MNRRKLVFFIMLVGAGVGPYVASSNGFATLKAKLNSWFQSSDRDDTSLSVTTSDGNHFSSTFDGGDPGQFSAPSSVLQRSELQSDSTKTIALHQVFDFNMTPDAIVQHWPRVSTSLATLEMSGMRVALVTGTRPEDLHGSLSYYFDAQQRLQRITFHGKTGDPREIVALMTQYHGFKSEKSLGAGLYTKKWNGKPTSALWIENAPLISADGTNSRYAITLEVNRTDGPYRLSQEFAERLDQLRQAGRW